LPVNVSSISGKIASNINTFSAKIKNDALLNVIKNDDNISFNIVKLSNQSVKCIFEIEFDDLSKYTKNELVFSKENKFYSLSSNNALFELDDNGRLAVIFSEPNNYLTLREYDNQLIKSMAFISGANIVDENTYMPEFSIGTFDDENFVFSRPIRFGVPILSTVPASIGSTSLTSDINYYNTGQGNYTKTIYLRIICNKIMETISAGETSIMQLKVYMPNGLDTVKPPLYLPMYLVSTDSTNNISIYQASHDFYIQGSFDGVDYVDGYMYFDVQVPLTVQKSMPVEFDFSL
jgi:hypothetical protein